MSEPSAELTRGAVVWVDFDPSRGREQRGTRPALVIASDEYLASVNGIVVVLPITSVDRGWPHHVAVTGDRTGLSRPSFAMTEQPRTVSVDRLSRRAGLASAGTMAEVDQWLRDFLSL